MSEHIFSSENVEVNKPINIDVPQKSIVIVDNFHFKENLVSKIEVEKIAEYPDTIFISLYCGNIQIGDVVSKTSYMLDINNVRNVRVYYNLKPATKIDKERER